MWPLAFPTFDVAFLAFFGEYTEFAPASFGLPELETAYGYDGAPQYSQPGSLGSFPNIGGFGRLMPAAIGLFSFGPVHGLIGGAITTGSLAAGTAYGRAWTAGWDWHDRVSPGLTYSPQPETDAPRMPSGDKMIQDWFRAALGEYRDLKTGDPVDMNKVLDRSERKALAAWGKDPNHRGVKESLQNLIQHVAGQVQRGDAFAANAFLAEAGLNRRAAYQTTAAGISSEDERRLTNLLQFGTSDPAQRDIIEIVGQFLREQPPAGIDGAKPEHRVASLLKMYATAFGDGDPAAGMVQVRRMLLELEDLVVEKVQGTVPLPAMTEGHVRKALADRGYEEPHIQSIAAALAEAVNARQLHLHDAWWILQTARSVEEENAQGHLPHETANRLAFDLLLEIRLSKNGRRFDPESRDPADLRRRLARVVPLRRGTEQWTDWKFLVGELNKATGFITEGKEKELAAWENRKLRGQ